MSAKDQTLRAHMTVHDAKEAIAFYAKAFGATEQFRLTEPSGRVGHAEIKIGDSVLMLNDEYPDFGAKSPAAIGGSPVAFHIQVADADKAVDRAVKAGATLMREVQDQFYGDRSGTVEDPFGHVWHISTHVEDVPTDELKRRAEQAMGNPAADRSLGR